MEIGSWNIKDTAVITDTVTFSAAQAVNEPNPALRFNSIGASLGYQGVSAFGFTVSGTVSPANYTFLILV